MKDVTKEILTLEVATMKISMGRNEISQYLKRNAK
jgi:hypothetical protein